MNKSKMPPLIAIDGPAASGKTTIGQQLAEQLRGELRDETRSVLTHSAIDHIRQQVAEYDCKWLDTHLTEEMA